MCRFYKQLQVLFVCLFFLSFLNSSIQSTLGKIELSTYYTHAYKNHATCPKLNRPPIHINWYYWYGHWNLILCLASPALVMKIVLRLIIKNPKKIHYLLKLVFSSLFLINLRCFKSQENIWNGQNMHSHAKTTTGVHQAVAQDLILPTITLNIC